MKTRTFVVVVNGAPRSGKDTFCESCKRYCDANELANVMVLSSVDPIKQMLYNFGWDGQKSDDIRDIIVKMKQIWINAQNGPTAFMLTNIMEFHKNHICEDNIVFLHIREPEEIDKIRDILAGFNAIGIEFYTILLTREQADHSDQRDADNTDIIESYKYDKILENNGDYSDLDRLSERFVDWLLG
jgi:hypothetical protein